MFFIFGWNHTKITEYGPVEQQKCANCHNTDVWQLKKISRYFTLFFIPIFPHDSENFYHCPICNYGLKLENDDFESYKAIAQTNTDCLEKKISEEERLRRLDEIHKAMEQRHETAKQKTTADSKNWEAVVSQRTSEDLQLIIERKSNEYNPAFIVAAKKELEKRKVNN